MQSEFIKEMRRIKMKSKIIVENAGVVSTKELIKALDVLLTNNPITHGLLWSDTKIIGSFMVWVSRSEFLNH